MSFLPKFRFYESRFSNRNKTKVFNQKGYDKTKKRRIFIRHFFVRLYILFYIIYFNQIID